MEIKVGETGRELTAKHRLGHHHSILVMIVLAGAAALAVVVPFFFLGNASGHDFEFHLASWMDVARQWHEGVLYPRWAAFANWDYGEPRFIFYPPASWMLGAALSFIFPWSMVPGAFIWLALTLAGVAMFALAREWLEPPPPATSALGAGVLFALNPYHLVIVYWRSDFAELLASALIPLAVLFAMRTATAPRRGFLPLALVSAAVWLSNAPAAVIVTYTIVLILVVVAAREHSARPLIYGAGALALGWAAAALYILPAMFEQPWVNISEVLAQGLQFPENFLFTRTADAEHTRFNFNVSWVAVAVIVATIGTLIASRRLRSTSPRLWWLLFAVVAVSIFLMLPVASPVWRHAPELRYVQFPWRWLLVLDVPFAFCVAAALVRLRGASRYAAWGVTLAGLAIAGLLLTRSNWWDAGGAVDFYEEHFRSGAGYFGVDEYGPRGSDHYDLDQKAPLVSVPRNTSAEPGARIQVQEWGPMQKRFLVHSPQPVTAALRLLNYPAWHVEVNGMPAVALSSEHTDQMLVPLPAGTSYVRVSFASTLDCVWGNVISAVAALALLAAGLASRRHGSVPARARRMKKLITTV
jgi:hypothetical protein